MPTHPTMCSISPKLLTRSGQGRSSTLSRANSDNCSPLHRRCIQAICSSRLAPAEKTRDGGSGLAPGWPKAFEDVDEADLVNGARVAHAAEAIAAVIGAHAACANSAEGQRVLRNVQQSAIKRDAT